MMFKRSAAMLAMATVATTTFSTAFASDSNGISGVSPVLLHKRLLGGSDTAAAASTFVARIYTVGSDGKKTPRCAGAFLSNNFVLTAAHCVDPSLTPGLTGISIGYGSPKESDLKFVNADFANIKRHPDYQNGIPANNIAIVPLTGAVSFDATVQPIGVMPGPVADGDDNLFVFGWGATSGGGSPSSTLQRAAVTAGQTSKCQSNFQPFTGQDGNYVCVAFKKSGADTCVGDGGSPLVKLLGNKIAALVGVMSHAYGTDGAPNPKCGGDGNLSYFASSKNYLPFILSATGLDLGKVTANSNSNIDIAADDSAKPSSSGDSGSGSGSSTKPTQSSGGGSNAGSNTSKGNSATAVATVSPAAALLLALAALY